MASSDPFKPVLGDDIGPTGAQRARTGLSLVAFLVVLGILAAASLGLAAVLVWAVFTAALGLTMASRSLDPVVARRRAAALAGHTGDADAARALLGDDDAGVRAAALGALHRMDELDRDELLAALSDPDPTQRRRACEVAATFAGAEGSPPDPVVAAAVAALLDDDEPIVVETAAWSCGERPPAAPEVVARLAGLAADHDDALCREAAVAALGALGDPAGLPAILAATHDKATVRRRAVIALAPFDGPEVDEALERAREDRDWQVRQAAEDLLTP